jgi:hypothetical protein
MLGHFLKDRIDSSLQRLVLYDRCALDMSVDPHRYGLASARGTRWLWKLSPKPDLVVLLYDHPERIHRRKPELTVEEIEHQLQQWLHLAESGEVDAIVQVNSPPEKIADQLRELIVEALLLKNRRLSLSWDEMEDQRSLARIFTTELESQCQGHDS